MKPTLRLKHKNYAIDLRKNTVLVCNSPFTIFYILLKPPTTLSNRQKDKN